MLSEFIYIDNRLLYVQEERNMVRSRKNIGRKIISVLVGLICVCNLVGCTESPGQNVRGASPWYLNAEIAPVYMDGNAIVTVVSDDGFYETGVHLNELADSHQLKVTVAGIVDKVDPYLREWQQIEKQGNVELISHSYSHLKMTAGMEFSEDELQHEITDSINYYKENFTTDQIAFIPPENTMCDRGYEILKENGIYAVRQGMREENSLMPMTGIWPSQWYRLYASGICDKETTEWRNSVVDSAITNNTWLIEMWHNVYKEGEPVGYQGISYELADEHMAYLELKQKEGKIWVASLVDATKYIHERKYSTVEAIHDDDIITIKVMLDDEKLPTEIFNHPLTVKIPLPEEWNNLNVKSKDEREVIIKEDNNVKYILVEMSPNEEVVIQGK